MNHCRHHTHFLILHQDVLVVQYTCIRRCITGHGILYNDIHDCNSNPTNDFLVNLVVCILMYLTIGGGGGGVGGCMFDINISNYDWRIRTVEYRVTVMHYAAR